MKLSEILELKKGDVISLSGAGGKTTFMFALAEELRTSSSVLVTTTTKIYMPEKNQYDYISTEEPYIVPNNAGIYVCGGTVNSDKKITGIDTEMLNSISEEFDYTIIEADGSKKKPLKAWGLNEPVISDCTTITVGILGADILGKKVNEDNIHRLDIFKNLTGLECGDIFTLDRAISLIFHSEGLFKNSIGKRVLFINKAEGDTLYKNAICIAEAAAEANKSIGLVDAIILGSLHNGTYARIDQLSDV